MKYFVTGATGFIGSRLVEKLSAESDEVYCLIRSPQKLASLSLNGNQIHPVFGDLDNFAALLQGCNECDIVFHLAALAKPWSKDANLPYLINVQGTMNLLEAALKSKVKKFIFTSSAAVFGPSNGIQIINENSIRETHFFNDYESTKAQAEKIVLEYGRQGLPVVILNPTRVFGPGPITESNSVTKIIKLYIQGLWRIIPGNGKDIGNYVYIDDVVEGHLLAAKHGNPGEKYIIGGENLTFNQFFQTLKQITGRNRLLFNLPVCFMIILATFLEFQTRITGIPPFITTKWVRKYLNHWNLSSEKAIRQLGYKITPFNVGVMKTLSWLNNKT